jgi:hypothetical protein
LVDNRSGTLFFMSKLGDGVLFILLVVGEQFNVRLGCTINVGILRRDEQLAHKSKIRECW